MSWFNADHILNNYKCNFHYKIQTHVVYKALEVECKICMGFLVNMMSSSYIINNEFENNFIFLSTLVKKFLTKRILYCF